jgi:hypothetical protein
MLRLSHALWLFLPAATLGGCPVYSDGCGTDEDCDYGYACQYASGQCIPIKYETQGGTPPRCRTTDDCDDGLVCDRYSRCVTEGGEAGAGGDGASGAAGHGGGAGAP